MSLIKRFKCGAEDRGKYQQGNSLVVFPRKQVGLIADAPKFVTQTNIQQSIAYRMSRVPAVWRYAASAVGSTAMF
jgi:hypothetical protein